VLGAAGWMAPGQGDFSLMMDVLLLEEGALYTEEAEERRDKQAGHSGSSQGGWL